MVSRFQGSGREKEGGFLAVHKRSFNAHVTGGDYKHDAEHVNVDTISTLSSTNTQGVLEELANLVDSAGTGFISVGSLLTAGRSGKYNVTSSKTFEEALAEAFVDNRLANGGIVLILAGEYTMTSTVTIPAGITLMGEVAGTTIIGETTEESMFLISATSRSDDIGANSGGVEEPLLSGAPVDAVKLFNLTITDNSNETIKSGILPISTMQTVPMIDCRVSSHLICEEVRFIGRVNGGSVLGRGKTLQAIGGYTVGGSTKTVLSVKRCYFDGFRNTINFIPLGGDSDFLLVDSCQSRIFGPETSADSGEDSEKNCFVYFSACNAHLINNYHIAEDNGTYNTANYCFVIRPATGSYTDSKINITGNVGAPADTVNDILTEYSGVFDFSTLEVEILGNTWGYSSLTIEESSLYGKVWKNKDDTIVFYDKNMIDNSVQPHALTDDGYGADKLTVLDKDPTLDSTTFPVPPSIFQAINSKFTVTVGDGVNTFGDFNGVDAIHRAIDFFDNNVKVTGPNGVKTLLIQCKNGTYLAGSNIDGLPDDYEGGTISIPGNTHVIIDGAGLYDGTSVVIESDETDIINFAGTIGSLTIRNLTLQRWRSDPAVLPTVPSKITLDYRQTFIAENVYFNYVTLNFKDCYRCFVDRCEFLGNGVDSGIPLVNFELSGGQTIYNAVFTDCIFLNSEGSPVVEVKANSSSITAATVKRILFERCSYTLGLTVDDGNNLTSNCGVINLNPNGSSSRDGNEGVTIEEIVWRDCKVLAQYPFFGKVPILIHLINSGNGVALTSYSDSWMDVEKVVIDGGEWLCSDGEHIYNPFTIAVEGEVIIKDAVFGYSGLTEATHGKPTDDLGFIFTGSFGDSPPVVGEWGSMALFANNLKIDNLRFLNSGDETDSGDLFVRWKVANIENVYIDNEASSPGSYPDGRVRFRQANGSQAFPDGYMQSLYVSNFIMNGYESLTNKYITGVVIFEPSEHTAIFNGLNITGYEGSGFVVLPTTEGSLYTDSPTVCGNLLITNSSIVDCYGEGFSYDNTDNSSFLYNLRISNSFINRTIDNGIYINGSSNLKNVSITNNIISWSYDGDGISLNCDDWAYLNTFAPIVIGNHCHNNWVSDIAFRVGSVYPPGGRATIAGVCLGNSTVGSNGDVGYITGREADASFDYVLGGTAGDPANVPIIGMETHYGMVADGFPTPNRTWSDDERMLYNFAIYKYDL